jgi:hypothetical protein
LGERFSCTVAQQDTIGRAIKFTSLRLLKLSTEAHYFQRARRLVWVAVGDSWGDSSASELINGTKYTKTKAKTGVAVATISSPSTVSAAPATVSATVTAISATVTTTVSSITSTAVWQTERLALKIQLQETYGAAAFCSVCSTGEAATRPTTAMRVAKVNFIFAKESVVGMLLWW